MGGVGSRNLNCPVNPRLLFGVPVVRLGLAIRIVYILCLTVATYNHALIVLRHGWDWDYGGMPIGTGIFWTSLTLLDPLVATLLIWKPRPAIIMLVILIVSDVAHDTWVILKFGGAGWMVADQWIFLGLVLTTIAFVWRASGPSAWPDAVTVDKDE
jgi:hypothetical protein